MKPKDIMFSVNEYDRDGDCTEKGIFLHFGETRLPSLRILFGTLRPCAMRLKRTTRVPPNIGIEREA